MDKIAGLKIQNTRDVFNENTRLCMMIYEAAKRGKTTFAAGLDEITKKYLGKPTLFIAIEAAEGGGTMSIQRYGVDYVTPSNLQELSNLVTQLYTDKYYGGVVFDSATEYAKAFLQPFSLKQVFNGHERYPTRAIGVPSRGDYQIMGEKARMFFNQLVRLTSNPNLDCRKHLIVTALIKEKMDDDGSIIRVTPDLPGSMADACTGMFQTVAQISVRHRSVKDPNDPRKVNRVCERVFRCKPDGKEVMDDRMNVFPSEYVLTAPDGTPITIAALYEEYWLKKLEELKK